MPIIGGRSAGVRGLGFQGAGKPGKVITFTATDVGSGRAYNNGRIDISWTAPSSNGAPITGYLIERSTNSGSTWSTLISSNATTSYSDTGLSSATRYDYRVTAINAVGSGEVSSSVNATATTVPQAPTVGAASRAADNQVSLAFTANANGGSSITSYTIVASPSISVSTNAGTTSPRTATASFGSGTSYTFTIAAVNANGTSAASSASGSVMPNQPAPSSVEYVVVSGGGTGYSGGGGAGGVFAGTQSVSAGTNYSISIAGGGGTSNFISFTPSAGGNGGQSQGNAGASGGGCAVFNNNGRGNAIAGQGHIGGKTNHGGSSGGGGGYGGPGSDGRKATDPNNGNEFTYSEPGQAGGGGGAYSATIEGGTNYYAYGGGGFGQGYYPWVWSANGDASDGAANSGAGGGGWGFHNGGSGTVILAHSSNEKSATVSGGLSYNLNTNSRAGYKVYKFTGGSGNVSW